MLLEGYSQGLLRLQAARRLSIDPHLARGRFIKACQQTQDCAFAASGGADQGYEFTIAYLYVERTEGSKGFPPTCRAAAQVGSRNSG